MIPAPGGRAPAPWPLRSIQVLVNTLDIENGVDVLTSDDELRAALRAARVIPEDAAVGPGDVEAARSVREALRALLLANNGGAVERPALEVLERAAAAGDLSVSFDATGRGTVLPQRAGVPGALARLVAIAAESMADGSWRRLKACPREVCHWVFYDRSRNGGGRWCAMSVCGNRIKTRSYRRRRRASA